MQAYREQKIIMTEQNPGYSKNVYELFLRATREMENADQRWSHRQYEKFIDAIKNSARCLAKALIVASGINLESEGSSIDAHVSKQSKSGGMAQPVFNSILTVISLQSNSPYNEESLAEIRKIYQEYNQTLVTARQLIAGKLKYNAEVKSCISDIFFNKGGRKRIAYPLLTLFLLIATTLIIYYSIDPEDTFELDGQVFWKEKPGVPFTAENSKRFTVFPGDKSHEYSIVLDAPVTVYLLRLDPVNQIGLTDIEIDWIRLYGAQGELVRDLIFDTSMYWSCDNCIKKESSTHSFRMQPTSNDPYITSSVIEQRKVKKIIISLRAVAKKTFWEWLLGIDKNLEF